MGLSDILNAIVLFCAALFTFLAILDFCQGQFAEASLELGAVIIAVLGAKYYYWKE